MNINEMLIESMNEIYQVIKDRNKYDKEETKILIASANTLQQTAKTLIQAEILQQKLNININNAQALVHKVSNEN